VGVATFRPRASLSRLFERISGKTAGGFEIVPRIKLAAKASGNPAP